MSLANLCQRFSRMMTTTNLKTTHKFVTSRCIMINLSIHLLSWPWPPCKMQTKLILYFWTLDLTLALGTCDSLTGSIVCATIAHFCSNNTFNIENQGLRSCPLISCYIHLKVVLPTPRTDRLINTCQGKELIDDPWG